MIINKNSCKRREKKRIVVGGIGKKRTLYIIHGPNYTGTSPRYTTAECVSVRDVFGYLTKKKKKKDLYVYIVVI